jgi:1-acyl-sn-glycerol-3-phosphate acyltransferase
MSEKTDNIVDINRPPPGAVALMFAPLRAYFSPVFYGLDNIDEKIPHMFVGNHTIHGVFDSLLVFTELYRVKGIRLRGIGDHVHFSIPLWRDFVKWTGGVPGTRENCKKLMKAGENIVIMPGGGQEVCKRKGETYKLIWKKRFGFVRLAVEHNYPIMPFAMVGAENAFSIIFDRNDTMNSFMGKFTERAGILKDTCQMPGHR